MDIVFIKIVQYLLLLEMSPLKKIQPIAHTRPGFILFKLL